jgi:hypothetical protein
MTRAKFFALACILLGIFVFYANDKETGLLIIGLCPLILIFNALPLHFDSKTDSTANQPHNPNDKVSE